MTPWQIAFEGNLWPETSLTVSEAIDVARLARCGWNIHPLVGGPEVAAALLAVLCSTRLGEDLDVAIKRVRDMSASDLLGCVQKLGE